MSIIRAARPEVNWYALDKRISEDTRLSWSARGLLVFLLGKPNNWRVSVDHLRKQTEGARIRTGRDGVYALLTELQGAGYVVTRRPRLSDGTLGAVDYIVREYPLPAQAEVVEQPLPAQPDPAQPDPAETTLTNTETASITENHLFAQAVPAPSRFDDWWTAYPKKVGKKPCAAKWKSRGLDRIADTLIADVRKRTAEDDGWKRGFIPDPLTYLNQDRWEDELRKPPQQRGTDGRVEVVAPRQPTASEVLAKARPARTASASTARAALDATAALLHRRGAPA